MKKMDRRELKKQLLAEMLMQYRGIWDSMDPDAQEEGMALTMDMERPLSKAAINRYIRVMNEIVDQAATKAGY
jgi:hypothetical protein